MLLKMGYEYYGNGYEYYGDCLRLEFNNRLIDSEISKRRIRLKIIVSIGGKGWLCQAEWDFGIKHVRFC